MVVDNDGKPVPHYQIGKPYASTSYHECVDLGEAVFYATAVALHRGYSMEVRRVVPREPQSPETTGLFTITPNSFDFRKVKPETSTRSHRRHSKKASRSEHHARVLYG
jgi:hypothetical protein